MDLTDIDQVAIKMASSKNFNEWNTNEKLVLEANGNNHPIGWYDKIIMSGLYNRTITNFDTPLQFARKGKR